MFIAVHLGAGSHSIKKEKYYNTLSKKACIEGMKILKLNEEDSLISAITRAIQILEDNPMTNAGIGSNLNRGGKVECDASMMCGRTGAFGAVGASDCLRNPIKFANVILRREKVGSVGHKFGLIPPMLICGSNGVKEYLEFVNENCSVEAKNVIEVVNNEVLVTSERLARFKEYTDLLLNDAMSESGIFPSEDLTEDTVGAIAMDLSGNVFSGVSSGGIWLKHPGRIGEAAVFGAGCWSENHLKNGSNLYGFATSATGAGEMIIRSQFSSALADSVMNMRTLTSQLKPIATETVPDHLKNFVKEKVFKQSLKFKEKNLGAIFLKSNFNLNQNFAELEFWFLHSTKSLAFGYIFKDDLKPTCVISRKSSTGHEDFIKVGCEVKCLRIAKIN
ncbi:taspase, threonine aspartase, 1 [Lobulomyces angularis]|nr:taspase, threonine aspartase, 1 [Lobulomyces angularis]